MTNEEAHKLYREANDNGEGFAPGNDGDNFLEAVEREGWLPVGLMGELLMARGKLGEHYLIGDANGPWAVAL